jgi:hypothetical protein
MDTLVPPFCRKQRERDDQMKNCAFKRKRGGVGSERAVETVASVA